MLSFSSAKHQTGTLDSIYQEQIQNHFLNQIPLVEQDHNNLRIKESHKEDHLLYGKIFYKEPQCTS